jgi:hypothetical protein
MPSIEQSNKDSNSAKNQMQLTGTRAKKNVKKEKKEAEQGPVFLQQLNKLINENIQKTNKTEKAEKNQQNIYGFKPQDQNKIDF